MRNRDLAKTLLEQNNQKKEEEDRGEQGQEVGEPEESGTVPSDKEPC